MLKKLPVFWRFQLAGWLVYFCIQLIMNYTMARPFFNLPFVLSVAAEIIAGIIITTLLHSLILKLQITEKGVTHQLLFILISSIIFALPLSIVNLKMRIAITKIDNGFSTVAGWISFFLLVLAWNITYFFSRHIVKNNEAKLNKLRLESLVKELELKTIKAHINPHFIFNALTSIRNLASESSERTREAIMQLSDLLRSSMQMENVTTTPLQTELHIVNSYLQLEKLRFEDWLRVELDIDDNTLNAPVPPMLLQTLVENGIKHGVSKFEEGGKIKVSSKICEGMLRLTVINTGQLNPHPNSSGFGLKSVEGRLRLLYGNAANFSIRSLKNNLVEAEVNIPLAKVPSTISVKTIVYDHKNHYH